MDNETGGLVYPAVRFWSRFMFLNKNNLIPDKEAKILCEAIEEIGKLEFPLSTVALGAVAGLVYSAQSVDGEFRPNLMQRLLSKINYSFASVASFVLWIGAKNVLIATGCSKESGKQVLTVTLKEGENIDWGELRAKKFSSPLIS